MLYRGFSNHYFGTVLQSAADAICDAGKTVLFSIMPDTDEPLFLRTVIANHLLDGLILIDSTIDLAYLPTLLSYDLPVVFVGRRPDAHFVGPDNFAGALMAADYLHAQGCQRIVALYGPTETNYSALDRKAGFETGLEAHGIPHDSVWAGYADHKAELAQELMCDYLHDRPDAVFAGDANTTAGVMRALDTAGIRVPDDLIVVGFSGHMIDESCANQVVNVALPLESVGQKAVDVLVDVLANPPDVPVHVLLKPELIV
jgi:DNA-binding LacI/PurR family transcriptional regulator